MKKLLFIIFLLLCFISQASEIELEIVTEEWPPFIVNGKEVSGVVTKNIKSPQLE